MANFTREQVNRWNAKLSNGFRLDLQRLMVSNEKVASLSIEMPDGAIIKAEIGWYKLRENWKVIGVKPRLCLSRWTPANTSGVLRSSGLGAKVEITENVYQKRSWNELAKFTAEWDEKRLLAEVEKHMAKMKRERNLFMGQFI